MITAPRRRIKTPAEQRDEIDDIKRRYDLRDIVARDLGEPVFRNKRYNKHRAPWRDDPNPSLAVHPTFFKDFGSQDHKGDIFSWFAVRHGLTFRETLEKLSNDHDLPVLKEPRRDLPTRASTTVHLANWSRVKVGVENLDDRARKYYHNREITDEVIEKYRLGYNPRVFYSIWDRERQKHVKIHVGAFSIPNVRGNTVVAIQYRRDDEAIIQHLDNMPKEDAAGLIALAGSRKGVPALFPKYKTHGSTDRLFGVEVMFNDEGRLKWLPYIAFTEGALDAYALQSHGFPALGFNNNAQVNFAGPMQKVTYGIAITDGDQAGDEFAERIKAQTPKGVFHARFRPPDGMDVTELLQTKPGMVRAWFANTGMVPQGIEGPNIHYWISKHRGPLARFE